METSQKRIFAGIGRVMTWVAGLVLGAALLVAAPGLEAGRPHPAAADGLAGKIVVANRAAGTLSVIDTATDQVSMTVPLPAAGAEPMYVVHAHVGHRVFVGDRANNQVVVFDADDFSVAGTVATGAGVFHMWINPQNTRLWVNNDIDNTATLIDPHSLSVEVTVPMPADLVAQGGKPHDVVLDLTHAYVTMVGLPGDDMVVKFCQRSLREVGRAPVGEDPHVALSIKNRWLYVPSQNSNTVLVLERKTLARVAEIAVPGAHGAGMPLHAKTFYTTNLPGGGSGGLVAIDIRSQSVLGAVDTPLPVPHNIALIPSGRKIYVTHSGASANRVTVYAAERRNPLPTLLGEIEVGTNPFGLAFVP